MGLKSLLLLCGLVVLGCGNEETPGPSSPEFIVEPLVQGGPVAGTNGMAFDSAGRLYVAGAYPSRITVLNSDSGEILDVLTPEHGVTTPDDVAVGPDGSVYWTALLTGEVGRLTPQRTYQRVAFLGVGVNPIVFSPTGRLFSALCFTPQSGEALYELDPSGATAPRVIARDIGGGCALNGMKFGPDGRLYGPQPPLGRIVAIDVDTGALEVIATGFGFTLYGVGFAPDGTLYGVDGTRVFRVDRASGTGVTVATLPFIADNLILDRNGRLFVSGVSTAEIVEVRADGSLRQVVRGGLHFPQGLGLVTGASGTPELLVAHPGGISRYDAVAGATLAPVSVEPFAASGLTTSSERWLSSSALVGVVSVWDPATTRSFPLGFDFRFPAATAFFEGSVLVAEAGGGVVTRVRLDAPGSREVVTRAAATPAGLAVSGRDVWVSDVSGGTVLQIIRDGAPLEPALVVASGLSRPQGLVADGQGGLVVLETGAGKVSRIGLSDGQVRVLTDTLQPANPPLPGTPTDSFTQGITASADGTLYVSDPLANRVLRIRPAR